MDKDTILAILIIVSIVIGFGILKIFRTRFFQRNEEQNEKKVTKPFIKEPGNDEKEEE